MKSILFVCTGNSARSIIAESIINKNYSKDFKAYSAGSNPSAKINPHIKEYLITKKYDVSNLNSKNFNVFLKDKKGRPVSRILSSLIIYLDIVLLQHSSRLPNYIGRAVLKRNLIWRCTA